MRSLELVGINYPDLLALSVWVVYFLRVSNAIVGFRPLAEQEPLRALKFGG